MMRFPITRWSFFSDAELNALQQALARRIQKDADTDTYFTKDEDARLLAEVQDELMDRHHEEQEHASVVSGP